MAGVIGVQLASGPTASAEPRAVELARRYIAQGALPAALQKLRTVQAGCAARRVQRVVVPITRESMPAFLETFSLGQGFASLRYRPDHEGHLGMLLQPNTLYFYGARCDWGHDMHFPVENGGLLWPLDLGRERIAHLTSWLDQGKGHALKANDCMYWLPNAELKPGQSLFHWLGITRSLSGHNMKAKLNHAANDRLQVVGVCLPDGKSTLEGTAFDKLTDAQILGAAPAAGVDEAIR